MLRYSIKNGWLQGAVHFPSPHWSERPLEQRTDLLVIHNISLPPGQFGGPYITDLFLGQLVASQDPFFAQIAELKVSAHCLIRRDGEVIQYVSFDHQAWHAGVSCFNGRDGCNQFSIGIELEGTDFEPFTTQQYAALAKLTTTIKQEYPDIVNDNIVGHSDIAPERKTDPGPFFDWPRFFRLLENSI